MDNSKSQQRIESALPRLITQIRTGCQKEICFNRYCARNVFTRESFRIMSESDLRQEALEALQKAVDPEDLICYEGVTLTRNKLKSCKQGELTDLIENVHAFCCSFVSGSQHSNQENSQASQNTNMVVEESSFAMGEETESQQDVDMTSQNQSSQQASISLSMRQIQIDHKAVYLYFQSLKACFQDQAMFRSQIETLVELIYFEFTQNEEDQYKQLMSVRGMMMLMLMEQLEDFEWFSIACFLFDSYVKAYQTLTTDKVDQNNVLVDYLKEAANSEQYVFFVKRINAIMKVNIDLGLVNLDLLETCIRLMDLFYRVNKGLSQSVQIELELFQNKELNDLVDFKTSMLEWARFFKSFVRNGQVLSNNTRFNPCNYHWIFNPDNKNKMLNAYNELEQYINHDTMLLSAFWDPELRKKQKEATNFVLVIKRDQLLEESLQKLVKIPLTGWCDKLKLPLKVEFEGEPGIDEGGVRKEYFQLIMQELFDQQYGMFKYNEDVQMFWFNGQTYEPNINFELVGTLMGIAIYNNLFLDFPIAPACYKILLDQKPDLEDLRKWQPEVASSLDYILKYEGDVSLEDLVCRTFTITQQQFGETKEIDLIEGGNQIYVTKENRKQFVELYIEYEFEKQCADQLNYFKKGFYRMCDNMIIKELFDAKNLELMICGTRVLDFGELKKAAYYRNGFHEMMPVVQWFWDIILNEYNDDQRRKLLAFSTGSDRAPVKGLGAMRFIIEMDGEDSEKLPTSHTCFNQLLIPKYSSKEKLRIKLQQAIENATGFGMV